MGNTRFQHIFINMIRRLLSQIRSGKKIQKIKMVVVPSATMVSSLELSVMFCCVKVKMLTSH